MFYGVPAQQCATETSIYGMMLKQHVFKKITTTNWAAPAFDCIKACNNDIRCQSFNYVISQEMCELSNRTKEARPEDFVGDSDRFYYRRHKKRGKFMDYVKYAQTKNFRHRNNSKFCHSSCFLIVLRKCMWFSESFSGRLHR